MSSWQSMASVVAVSAATALLGAGCASQQDQQGNEGEDTQAGIARGAGEEALTAGEDQARVEDPADSEKIGEGKQEFWGRGFGGGWGRGFGGWGGWGRGFGGWGGGWGGWGGGWGGWGGGFPGWGGGWGGWGGWGGGFPGWGGWGGWGGW